MKKNFIIIYSVFCSLILIFAISFFAVNIYNENQHGSLRTQVRFEKMASAAVTTLEKTNISTSEALRQIENAVGDTKDFSYIKITSDNKTIYRYPDQLKDGEKVESNLILSYTKNINKTHIEAGLYTLRPGTIFYYAKISFIIILIVSLITIILIIVQNHSDSSKNKTYRRHVKKAIPQTDDEETEEIVADDEKEIEENTEEEFENEIIEEEQEEIQAQDNDVLEENQIEETEEESAEKYGSYEAKEEEIAELPTQDFEPAAIKTEGEEKGLFSPETGFGWESYFLTRLENELNRATASELDLALFVIKINGIGRASPVMKKICEYLTVEFQFKDLLFEYKDDCICAIKISMNIDDAVTFGEKLVSEIKNIALEESPAVYVGITTRGIRMVTGERLLKEADEAVQHAIKEDNCPVVGFRADAVKYRKFIETK